MAEILGHQLGNYRLIAHLGSGGNAHVFLGRHVHLPTQAAVKVLATQLVDEQVEQFRTEASIIAKLNHPNIIHIIDFGIDYSIPYLVMEYATQGSLKQRYPLGTRVPLDVVISYVKQIASALQYAHDQKLIHRDVKPENMLLGQNDAVLLSDFGIAIVARNSASRSLQEIAGTVPYMAPELFHGRPYFASDQYALGIVVYEWLSGARPFTGTYTEIAMQHERHQPPSLHQKVPTIPPAIENVVFTALEKDPRQRFASVMAFANALEKAAQFSGQHPAYSPPGLQQPFPVNLSLPATNLLRSTAVIQQSLPPPSNPTTSAPHPSLWKGGLSRRTIIAGSVAGAVAIAGSATAIALTHAPTMSAPVKKTASTIKATPRPATTPVPIPTLLIDHSFQAHVDAQSGKGMPGYDLAWSSDGKYLLSGGADQFVQVLDANTCQPVFQKVPGYNAVAWSPGTHFFATSLGATQAEIIIYSVATRKQAFAPYTHHHIIQRMAWSPDGNFIVSGDADGLINVWEPKTGKTKLSYLDHRKRVSSVAWSPKDALIASGGDANASSVGDPRAAVRVWDLLNGDTWYVHHHHNDNVKAVSWSPDGKMIASGGEGGDRTVVVWDTVTEKLVYQYKGHKGAVETVAWSHNGKYIASGSSDSTLHILDAATGKLLAMYTNTSTVWHLVWSPDDQRVAFSDQNGYVMIATFTPSPL